MNKEQEEKLKEYTVSEYNTLALEKRNWLLRQLIMEKPTIAILKFVRDNQYNELITKGEVVREMDKNQICSRPTTLKIIQRLLDYEILLDNKKRDNTFSRLLINKDFDVGAIELDVLASSIKEIKEHFEDFSLESKDVNTVLIDNLLTSVEHFSISKKADKKIKENQNKEITPKQRRK